MAIPTNPFTQLTVSQKRVLIQNYVNSQERSPLYFTGTKRTLSPTPYKNKNRSIKYEELILDIVKRTRTKGSFDGHGIRETYFGRSRSSLDIWRHAKAVFPKITIFKVMETLYKLRFDKKIFCHYCGTVNRTVFYPPYTTANLPYYNTNTFEYHMYFSDWEVLHE